MSLVLTVFIGCVAMVFAAPQPEAQPPASEKRDASNAATKKSTDMSFDELLVQGKYHFTDEAVTTVEQDKVLDGLLEVRKDFKDRIQQSTTRY